MGQNKIYLQARRGKKQITEGEQNEKSADGRGGITEKKYDRGVGERLREGKSGVILRAKTAWNPLPRAPSGTLPHHHTPTFTVLMMSYYNKPLHSPT